MIHEKTQLDEFCLILNKLSFDGINNQNSSNLNLFNNQTDSNMNQWDSLLKIDNATNVFDGFDMSNFPENMVSIEFQRYIKILCENRLGSPIHLGPSFKQILIKYIYPIILIFGILGNIISLMVMIRIYKRKKNFHKFSLNLAALSLADLAVLLFGCFREYSDEVLDLRIRSSTVYMCKIIYFSCYLFSCFSAYLHAFISVERLHAITSPIKSKMRFEKNKTIITIIFLACVLISLPLIYFPELKQLITIDRENPMGIKVVNECEASQDYILFDIMLTLIDSVFYCFIPFLITFLFSILSLLRLFKGTSVDSKSKEPEMVLINSRNKSSTATLNTSVSLSTMSDRNKRVRSDSTRTANLAQLELYKINNKTSSNLKLSVMLLVLPISYLITTFPIFIIIILQLKINQFKKSTASSNYETELAIAKMFMYVNNSINILFYIFFGKSLRRDFLSILPFEAIFRKFSKGKKEVMFKNNSTIFRNSSIGRNYEVRLSKI